MDDVAESLRLLGDVVNQMMFTGHGAVTLLSGHLLIEAADEIKRLCAAGDALVSVLRSGSDCGWNNAIDAWEAVRHG